MDNNQEAKRAMYSVMPIDIVGIAVIVYGNLKENMPLVICGVIIVAVAALILAVRLIRIARAQQGELDARRGRAVPQPPAQHGPMGTPSPTSPKFSAPTPPAPTQSTSPNPFHEGRGNKNTNGSTQHTAWS